MYKERFLTDNYVNGFDDMGFFEWIKCNINSNSFVLEMIENIVTYAFENKNGSKDRLAYFISDIIPDIEFDDVAYFCEDKILTDTTLRYLDRM